MIKTDIETTRIIIDKRKVKERMDWLGIASYKQLAERTKPPLGEDADGEDRSISERTLYNIVDSDMWHSKMLYTLADVLDCSPLELLTAVIGTDEGKAKAPVGIEVVAHRN